ncbi:Maf family protein [Methylophaga sp. OBS4]|uniref:Maf family protein n=1 Tax=Methylophaga sp. OBS4 TaxID=2991935 RepID=UPI002252D9C3|nr:nucleoside triphosphate pyrophosphatase [Methylophaga sp. OBS4]MCX4188269.1 Maf-like protein [Methylophaga sp. OBS4]
MQQLILGSSSPFRAELLHKLGLSFIQTSPDIDETPLENETPAQLVERLAQQKAQALATTHPEALIIGSDQVAVIGDEILGKPGNHQNAMKQLRKASGKEVQFLTGLALYNAKNQHMQSLVEPFSVSFRKLNNAQIDFYLKREQPYQCAGSFKSEGFGISLFSKLSGDDPNTLIGLPLIQLIRLLANEDIDVLQLNR